MSEPQYEPLVSDDELSNMAFRCSGGFNAILHKLTLVRDQYEAKLAAAHASLQAMRAGVGAVRVTGEAREALDILLILTVDMADELWIQHDETEMHALGENYKDAARIVKAWRDGLGNETEGGVGDGNQG